MTPLMTGNPGNLALALQVGEVDPKFEVEALEQTIERSVSAIGEHRSDPNSVDKIPDRLNKE